MSTRPRPRPRPVPVAKPVAPTPSSSTPGASSTAPQAANTTDDDEDAMFMRNRSRDVKTWRKLKEIEDAKEKKITSGAESDGSMTVSPRRRKKKANHDKSMPEWTRNPSSAILLLSSDEDDVQILDRSKAGNAGRNKANENKKRARSRSRSITPPPELPAHALATARQTIRQLVGLAPRAESPTWVNDDSTDTIVLAPELAEISRQVRIHRTADFDQPSSPVEDGGPEVVAIKVIWRCHPLNTAGTSEVWDFKMKRSDMFRDLFNEVADVAGILSDNLMVTYENSRLFPSATPHSIGIWAEGELEACDKVTYEYLRESRRQRSLSIQPVELSPSHEPLSLSDDASSDSGTESATGAGDDTFRLTLRSGKTKDVQVTVRPTTTCGAIVRAFLKKTGLAEQYAVPAVKKRGRKSAAAAGAGPSLMLDGDKMDPESAIGDADLEDGDLVEVVGL